MSNFLLCKPPSRGSVLPMVELWTGRNSQIFFAACRFYELSSCACRAGHCEEHGADAATDGSHTLARNEAAPDARRHSDSHRENSHISISASAEDPQDHERGRLGSKQLRTLRTRLERNRLTMPLFDTKGWVRDFEKALKIQCASLQLSTVRSFPHRACAYLLPSLLFLLRPLRTGEIYANGLSPMHIVVARSDRLYGTEEIHRHPSNGAS